MLIIQIVNAYFRKINNTHKKKEIKGFINPTNWKNFNIYLSGYFRHINAEITLLYRNNEIIIANEK